MFWSEWEEWKFRQVCLKGRSLIVHVNKIKWEINVEALLYFILLYRPGLQSLYFTYQKCYMTKGPAVVLSFNDTVWCLRFSPLKDEHLDALSWEVGR